MLTALSPKLLESLFSILWKVFEDQQSQKQAAHTNSYSDKTCLQG